MFHKIFLVCGVFCISTVVSMQLNTNFAFCLVDYKYNHKNIVVDIDATIIVDRSEVCNHFKDKLYNECLTYVTNNNVVNHL